MSSSSVSFLKKMRMSATFGFVGVSRIMIDSLNNVFNYFAGPLRRRWMTTIGDAPFMVVLLVSACVQYLPPFAVPSLQPWINPDTRRMLEEERIRNELQHGRDPHPYLNHREMTYGAVSSNAESIGSNVPRESVPECGSIDRFRERRQQQYDKEKHSIDAKIAELEKIADTDYTAKWIRMGIS